MEYIHVKDGYIGRIPTVGNVLQSRSFVVYETRDRISNKHFCRKCINGIWANITTDCSKGGLFFCERDRIFGSSVIKLPNNEQLYDSQNLFEPGTVMVIFFYNLINLFSKKSDCLGNL
jgi:hypothetical protein